MNPEELKVMCLKTVIPTLKCVKEGCLESPMCFLKFGDEYQVCCQRHFEISTFYHDGLSRYNTGKGNETRFTVYSGLKTAYLYTYPSHKPINRYVNIQRVIPSHRLSDNGESQHDPREDVDAVLIKLKKGFYLLVANYLCVFESEDEIRELYSCISESGSSLCCGAVGNEKVYIFPHEEPGSHYVVEKRFYPREMDWENIFSFQSTDILLNQRPLHSTLLITSRFLGI